MGCMSDRHAWNKDTPLPEFVLRQNVMLCRMSGIVGPCREGARQRQNDLDQCVDMQGAELEPAKRGGGLTVNGNLAWLWK